MVRPKTQTQRRVLGEYAASNAVVATIEVGVSLHGAGGR